MRPAGHWHSLPRPLRNTDERCDGHTREEMGKDVVPAGNDFLSNREVEAVVKYLFVKDVGKGPATYEDCVDFSDGVSLAAPAQRLGEVAT